MFNFKDKELRKLLGIGRKDKFDRYSILGNIFIMLRRLEDHPNITTHSWESTEGWVKKEEGSSVTPFYGHSTSGTYGNFMDTNPHKKHKK